MYVGNSHITVKEASCNGTNCCGGSFPLDTHLIATFEKLRSLCGDKAITITSAFRCLTYNRIPQSQGGPGSNDGSQHPKGTALDMKPPEGYTIEEFADLMRIAGFDGIGKYNTFCHGDVRGERVRWDERD